MNERKQRIAIAEACGYERKNQYKDISVWGYKGMKIYYAVNLPDYLNDLNAMHEAEKTLWNNGWETYSNKLVCLMGCTDIFHATAAQRAEAFLRVLNLWED